MTWEIHYNGTVERRYYRRNITKKRVYRLLIGEGYSRSIRIRKAEEQ